MLKVGSNNGIKEQCQYQNGDSSYQAQHSSEVLENLEIRKLVFIFQDCLRVVFLMLCSPVQ